ncbi:hypothetical protein [Burkholderia cepacia]|uniref:hypothetical protein n=1 Tax=Burkholderia cepacia TaxID=292 RepID=UPI00075CE73D|nr:hypothetical protein [Burkholderia cepacia]KVF22777.1 hypothetical protein WJ06_09400 [Burkholderia cepacia]
MSKQFTVGQRVKFNQPYAAIKVGDEGTIDAVGDRHVHVKMETGRRAGQVAVCYPYRVDAIKPEPKFKVGDKVRNVSDGGMKDYGLQVGKVYTVAAVRDNFEAFRSCSGERYSIQLAELLGGCSTHHRHEYQYELVEEPASEFRIRKHGTALREVRGIPFASQAEAEQAVSRYTPGSVYEIVEVKVVRTVKVEQEVRVIDYKEAA